MRNPALHNCEIAEHRSTMRSTRGAQKKKGPSRHKGKRTPGEQNAKKRTKMLFICHESIFLKSQPLLQSSSAAMKATKPSFAEFLAFRGISSRR